MSGLGHYKVVRKGVHCSQLNAESTVRLRGESGIGHGVPSALRNEECFFVVTQPIANAVVRSPTVGRFELLPQRLARILGQLSAGGDTEPGIDRLCALCASVTAMSGASIMLMSDELRGSVCSTDDVAHRSRNCSTPWAKARALTRTDRAAGRRAGPRRCTVRRAGRRSRPSRFRGRRPGGVRLPAPDRSRPPRRPEPLQTAAGPLSDDQHADALVMATSPLAPCSPCRRTHCRASSPRSSRRASSLQFVVHQASGMVAVQLDVTIDEALIRLRARAFAESRPAHRHR